MNATRFSFNVSVPCDAGGALIMRKLAEQAARYVGADASAERFGLSVEQAVHAQINGNAETGSIPITVRRSDGPVEVLVGVRTVALDV